MISTQVLANTPLRTIKGRVEHYKGSTLAATYNYNDNLISVEISRQGSGKFFGYGVSQKATVKLRDRNRSLTPAIGDVLMVYFSNGNSEFICNFAPFVIQEVKRNENTNEITLVAFDALSRAAKITGAELGIDAMNNYTIAELVIYIAQSLKLTGFRYIGAATNAFSLVYEQGANIEGTETIRELLNSVAEATQTIYYIDANNDLNFIRLDKDGLPVYTIDKSNYFTLNCQVGKQLGAIASVTELGDNLEASLNIEGAETQYIRDNPFYTMRDDLASLLEDAIAAVGGIEVNQFNCSWRGNYLLEIGDKIGLVTKDNNIIYSFFVNDTLKYNGGLSQVTNWEYTAGEETATNPTTLGEIVKQTYARVDKANKQIELVVSEAEKNTAAISTLQMDTNSIISSVTELTNSTKDAISGVNEEMAGIKNQVAASMDAEQVKILVETTLNDGVTQVTTNTDFTFNDDGLRVAKSNSEMETEITEDGMRVYKNGDEVLTADNEGVKAIDLHATTFLIIGNTSRLEDYNGRTACFWIGG